MQTIVTFDWSWNVANAGVGAASTANHWANRPVSKVYVEQIHHLFNYGMNACDDRVLVKHCIVQSFSLISARLDRLPEDDSFVINIFKLFRRHLTQQKGLRLFSGEAEMLRGLTCLQREALHLNFQCRLTYQQVADIIEIPIEQLRNEISKALVILGRQKMK